MTCCICHSPAHTVYAEGPEIAGFCAICDRIGAEDQEEL